MELGILHSSSGSEGVSGDEGEGRRRCDGVAVVTGKAREDSLLLLPESGESALLVVPPLDGGVEALPLRIESAKAGTGVEAPLSVGRELLFALHLSDAKIEVIRTGAQGREDRCRSVVGMNARALAQSREDLPKLGSGACAILRTEGEEGLGGGTDGSGIRRWLLGSFLEAREGVPHPVPDRSLRPAVRIRNEGGEARIIDGSFRSGEEETRGGRFEACGDGSVEVRERLRALCPAGKRGKTCTLEEHVRVAAQLIRDEDARSAVRWEEQIRSDALLDPGFDRVGRNCEGSSSRLGNNGKRLLMELLPESCPLLMRQGVIVAKAGGDLARCLMTFQP